MRGVHDLRLRIQHFENPRARGHGLLHLRVLHGQGADRVEEAQDEEREGDDDGNFDRAVKHPVAAVDDHDGDGRCHEDLNHRHDHGGQAACFEVLVQVAAVHAVESLGVLFLPREALYDAHAGDVLLQIRIHQRDGLPNANEGRPSVFLPDGQRDQQHGHDRQRERRQRWFHIKHGADNKNQHEQLRNGLHATRQKLLQVQDVVLDPRHDAAHFVLVIKAQGQALQVPEHLNPQGIQNPRVDLRHEHHLDVLRKPSRQSDTGKDKDDRIEAAGILLGNTIDAGPDEERHGGRRRRVRDHRKQGEDGLGPVGLEVGQKPQDDLMVIWLAKLFFVAVAQAISHRLTHHANAAAAASH